jgi:cell division protease FtsH
MKYFILSCLLLKCLGFYKLPISVFHNTKLYDKHNKKYPLSQKYYENALKRLNSKNKTIQNESILNNIDLNNLDAFNDLLNTNTKQKKRVTNLRIILHSNQNQEQEEEPTFQSTQKTKSENFFVVKNTDLTFKNIGGYDNIKQELYQCIDILTNHTKYSQYNVRTPRGLILEGPPGNGKTMIAKAFAGESKTSFISVSGSEFQEKYVGVGSSRIRELFKLASKNTPCIIFIDEIDALGRKRSTDGETSSSERDSTLNELLVALDGFKNNSGIFVIGATNRVDLLDGALIRPGRIDKKIYIGNPDSFTREEIINIHIRGKPHTNDINIKDLVDLTVGFSGAQIENLLNEAMLNSLRDNRNSFSMKDIDTMLNKMIAGWQPFEHQFSNDLIERIAVHEMGHAIMGIFSKHHSKVRKVVINLSSPNTPGYTLFEDSHSVLFTKESLLEHLAILLGGRIAEEIIYNVSVTTGAINDFEEALKLTEKMVLHYGMGNNFIIPSNSEKYKELIDNEIFILLDEAQKYAEYIINQSKDYLIEGANILKNNKILTIEELNLLMYNKYSELLYIQ